MKLKNILVVAMTLLLLTGCGGSSYKTITENEANELILNEATGAAICEFKGIYGGYYQLTERLLNQGCKIDRIGLQCHIQDSETFKNVYNAERLYGVLDGYSKLGKPIVLSEIGLSTEVEEIQAEITEQIYKTCFSVEVFKRI
mgnify:CR=1 FL=1